MLRDDLPHIIALTKIKGVGNVMARQLIAYCGGARAVFETRARELARIPNIGEVTARSIVEAEPDALAVRELTFINKHNIKPLYFLDDQYPRRLKHHEDSPILLYHAGQVNLNPLRTVGIVGTRSPSEYGRLMCDKLVEGLRSYGVMIISGMAYGIDSIAHRKSVELGIPTIGVLGHGLDRIYPQSNHALAKKMQKNGGLLTEFSSGTKPDRENFPMRNRIIAALSDVVIVVESKVKGGSIITAEFANGYNKDVFAVPGKINDEKSAGCNRLIKSHKAALIESAEDVGYIMRWDPKEDSPGSVQSSLFPDLDPIEHEIIDLIREMKEATVDAMHYRLSIPVSELSGILLNLEFKGLISSLPGKRYILK